MARIISLALLLTLTLAACVPDTKPWIGTWEGEIESLVPPDKDDVIAGTLRRVRVEISPDGKFQLEESGIPSDGIVRYTKDTAHLTIMNRVGRGVPDSDPDRELILKMQPDRTVHYSHLAQSSFSEVVLRKVQVKGSPTAE